MKPPDDKTKNASLSSLTNFLAIFGPGMALAATGVGAGDVTTTGLGAARMGLGLIWVPLLAAALKYFLNEGMSRYQLTTGRPLIHAWATEFGPVVKYGFLLYFIGWLVPVFATSITASGVAMDLLLPLEHLDERLASQMFTGGPRIADVAWSLILEIAVVALLWTGSYRYFESTMAVCVALMTITALGGTIAVFSQTNWEVKNLVPVQADQVGLCLGMMAGVGGTVVMLAYGPWIQERDRKTVNDIPATRCDLKFSYVFTGGFGVCMMLLVGGTSLKTWETVLGHFPEYAKLGLRDSFAVIGYRLEHDSMLPESIGNLARIGFGVGLLFTVLSSLLGMLQSMPRLLVEYFCVLREYDEQTITRQINPRATAHRLTTLACATLPCILVCVRQPAQIVIGYSVYASLFLPFMAASLLWLNRSSNLGVHCNSRVSNVMLTICLAVFAVAAVAAVWFPLS